MMISIEELHYKDNNYYIKFSSKFGVGLAQWKGDEPTIGKEYEVEFDFNNRFEWYKDIFESNINNSYLINLLDNNSTEFTANVKDIIDDNLLCISIGGSIMFLEVNSAPKNNLKQIRFICDSVEAYPIKL